MSLYLAVNSLGEYLALPEAPARLGSRAALRPPPAEWVSDPDLAARFPSPERALSAALPRRDVVAEELK